MKETPWATCLLAIVCSICMEFQKLNSFPTDPAFSRGKCWFLLLQPLAVLKITRKHPLAVWALPKVPLSHEQGDLIYKDWSSRSHCNFPWSYSTYETKPGRNRKLILFSMDYEFWVLPNRCSGLKEFPSALQRASSSTSSTAAARSARKWQDPLTQ